MPVEKEEQRFPWIPPGLTQLQPLPANTAKVLLWSCKKRTAAAQRCLGSECIFFLATELDRAKNPSLVFLTVGQKLCPVKLCRNRQIPLLIPKKLPPPVQNMGSTQEPWQCCPSSSGRRGWRSHSPNQAGQVTAMKRTGRRSCCSNEIILRGLSSVPASPAQLPLKGKQGHDLWPSCSAIKTAFCWKPQRNIAPSHRAHSYQHVLQKFPLSQV